MAIVCQTPIRRRPHRRRRSCRRVDPTATARRFALRLASKHDRRCNVGDERLFDRRVVVAPLLVGTPPPCAPIVAPSAHRLSNGASSLVDIELLVETRLALLETFSWHTHSRCRVSHGIADLDVTDATPTGAMQRSMRLQWCATLPSFSRISFSIRVALCVGSSSSVDSRASSSICARLALSPSSAHAHRQELARV